MLPVHTISSQFAYALPIESAVQRRYTRDRCRGSSLVIPHVFSSWHGDGRAALTIRCPAPYARSMAGCCLDRRRAGGSMVRSRRVLFGLLGSLIAIVLLADISWDNDAKLLHDHEWGHFAGARSALAQSSVFLQTFDGAPSTPQPW